MGRFWPVDIRRVCCGPGRVRRRRGRVFECVSRNVPNPRDTGGEPRFRQQAGGFFRRKKLTRWVEFNEAERDRLTKLISAPDLPFDDRLDAEALLAQVEREVHEQIVLRLAAARSALLVGGHCQRDRVSPGAR